MRMILLPEAQTNAPIDADARLVLSLPFRAKIGRTSALLKARAILPTYGRPLASTAPVGSP